MEVEMSFKTSLWIQVAVAVLLMGFEGRLGSFESQAGELQTRQDSSREIWSGLLQRQPYPYLVPLPEPKRSPLDGTFTKVAAAEAERVHCLRCPDYAPEGGVWKLNLDQGVLRILHPESRWKSIGTYIVAGDRLLLANDPTCIEALGLYRWRLDEGQLVLEVVDDPCAIKLRAMNLTQQPWQSCRPPNIEAAVSEHWLKPEGCDDEPGN
jgi:hypothetical protein